jgi:hypothetical protein
MTEKLMESHKRTGPRRDRLWTFEAACREVDPEIFFPQKADEEAPARRICRHCPVALACLKDALAQPGDVDGIWGNTNKRQRKRLRAGKPAKRATKASGNAAVNAAKTHCLRNHEYTPENTRWSNGTRSCVACHELRLEQQRAARRRAVAA